MEFFPFFGTLDIFLTHSILSYVFWISVVAVFILLLIRGK